ncbi:uncharacterized protein LOC122391069 isoform X1 [Amphibalanus amphitrite]|uniref:uncharacterized protein LOC122391069 isoform X1 n=1 Tax=Amphibalanus amphitrite TaxID=1232801 RepID=UPI001C91B4D4|nr:uncharacterized protein LOC122391069 isoform X1 [Amphibalanus amphitrite]XP_043240567.1 uncharacterized protein LOC122391069 isoform X1 [Amphibalanus amphitrite]
MPQGEETIPQETTPLLRISDRSDGCCCCQSLALALLTACVVVVVLAGITVVSAFSIIGYPWHASCQADWTFGKPCQEVMTSIVDQMRAWEGEDGCAAGGEKCLYQLISASGDTVTGTHTTPVSHYVDELTFTFVNGSATGACRMQGYSRSKTWYAYLDKGTNFCNMKNLIVGSGLDQADPMYSENTSDSVCTQYSSADCEKY